jgi:hypothetical protein
MAPSSDMQARLADLTVKVNHCLEPTRNSVDILVKKQMRKTVEKDLRNYVQGMVVRNINVTDEDRRMMGLPIYDTTPTPVADPTGQAEAEIAYPGRTQLRLIIQHIAGTPFNPKADYGYRIYYGLYEHGDTPPVSGIELHESRFTRQKKVLFSFTPADSGKTAFFAIRYENSKGKTGPWGPLFSAIIP